ncbi:MAG: long-chain fatty acid--CoA ligase [Gammaproteobacteria bacterium]|nr:long-chain fatty acid--CoA ligase [Gammaproteobacteria bacterium]
MKGLMMDYPLTVTSLMRHAEAQHGGSEVYSLTVENPAHRTTYTEIFRRCAKLANALRRLGLKEGDRVATMAWNDYRHMELYYGISCMGGVLHTVNPRLFPEQLQYIVNHAEDRLLFSDPLLLPLLEKLHGAFPTVEAHVLLCSKEAMPDSSVPGLISYEELIEGESDSYDWPDLDENLASSLCYTSGTTGNPKGVLFSHRSTVLHTYASGLADVISINSTDSVLPVVPMFHANAWGVVYSAPMAGARLVLPGPKAGDPEALVAMMNKERVSKALGVPTVWLGLLQYLEASGKKLETVTSLVVGGAACPRSMMVDFAEKHGIHVYHAWGMTEMSPLGSVNAPKVTTAGLDPAARLEQQLSQGRAPYGVEMRLVDDEGEELPRDGKAVGRLQVRGPWVANRYYRAEESALEDGWFDTGDVASIDPEGFMRITDRTKDLIKSGGEWISSIELEDVAMAHPAVAEAAVIATPHEKWSERPLLVVCLKEGESVDADALLAWFEGRVAKWWIPDAVKFADELPHTATGKVSKLKLRERFAAAA